MRLRRSAALAAALLTSAAGAAPQPASVDAFTATPALNPADAAAVTKTCDDALALGAQLRTALERETGAPTLASFRRFDDLTRLLDDTGNDAGLVAQVAADDARRDAARTCQGRVSDAGDAISLSRPIYDRLKGIDAARADPVARLLLARTLAAFDRAGVSRDTATRAKVTALKAQITALGLKFDANIANGRKTVTANPAELAGLPADFVAAHKPGADGKVVISTDYPDYSPVMSYARSEPLRHRLLDAYLTRGFPANEPILADMFARRDALAKLLGRPDFATLALEDKMVDTPAKARAFLDDISAAADGAAHRDYGLMLARLKQDQPGTAAIPAWSSAYVQQQIRKERFDLDPQEVRRYFAYDNVRDGILQLTRDLFGVEIRPWKTAVWDPSVEAYEMLYGGQVIGRFYFDTHPRPGKYSHANVVPIRMGLAGRVVPEAALVTNFPAGGHATGLMEHRDVETFLHEYGHLIHVIFSGRQDWEQASMGNVEWDFIEAPSQMLENWVWDYDTLSRFAVDEQGRPIPRALVAKMNAARYFAEALGDRRQLGLSNVSLTYHSGPPQGDLTAIYNDASDKYSLIASAPGTHPQDSFGHLNGYSAFYYTYMWSKAISTDLFTAFEKAGLRDRATAARYRALVLAPGGSRKAATLVESFLGRPLQLDAYRARLAKGQ